MHVFIISAAAIIPEEKGKLVNTPYGIIEKQANAYTKHFSVSYNKRVNVIFSWTWDGFKFFSTVALTLYLLQGPWDQQLLGTNTKLHKDY